MFLLEQVKIPIFLKKYSASKKSSPPQKIKFFTANLSYSISRFLHEKLGKSSRFLHEKLGSCLNTREEFKKIPTFIQRTKKLSKFVNFFENCVYFCVYFFWNITVLSSHRIVYLWD